MRSLLLFVLTLAACATVPRTTRAPVLDGTIDPAEWADADVSPIDGGSVRRMADDRFLYVAVEGDGRGIASVLVAVDDRVTVFHASAALGVAIYSRTSTSWKRTQDFDWKKTAAGWQANIAAPTGANREFAIERATLASNRLRIVAAYLNVEPDPMTLASWPTTPGDDATNIALHAGTAAEDLRFTPEKWPEIKLP